MSFNFYSGHICLRVCWFSSFSVLFWESCLCAHLRGICRPQTLDKIASKELELDSEVWCHEDWCSYCYKYGDLRLFGSVALGQVTLSTEHKFLQSSRMPWVGNQNFEWCTSCAPTTLHFEVLVFSFAVIFDTQPLSRTMEDGMWERLRITLRHQLWPLCGRDCASFWNVCSDIENLLPRIRHRHLFSDLRLMLGEWGGHKAGNFSSECAGLHTHLLPSNFSCSLQVFICIDDYVFAALNLYMVHALRAVQWTYCFEFECAEALPSTG